jgi:Cu+-exporting ATPase
MSTRTYRVEGMTCAACVARVEKALAAVPGVERAEVNFATERVSVDAPGVAEDALAAALGERGYTLLLEAAPSSKEDELRRAWLRLLAAWACALPLMAPMLPGVHLHLAWPVQALLAGGAAFGAGWPFLARALGQARKGETSMDTLVALGATVAWLFGVHEGLQGSPHPPFETAAALVAFLLAGKYLEARAKLRATDSLESLLRLAPATAWKLDAAGGEAELPVAALIPGDVVRVRPGQAVPVDGRILAGQADVDEALLTGEPLPVQRGPGDQIIAGAVVHGGSLDILVEARGDGTWLARLTREVAQAQGSRAPAQELADRVSALFVPVILGLAALTLAVWWVATGNLAQAWRPAVTLLVIACPCALGLATPVAMAAALGTAARNGLLVREAAGMARLAEVTDLVFDKTGTLTLGRPGLVEIRPTADLGEGPLLVLAGALERGSEHPLGKGLLLAAAGLNQPLVDDFRAHPGGGVSGVVEGRALRLGSAAFLGWPFPEIPAGVSAVGLADERLLLGVFLLADRLRPEAAEIVQALRGQGLRLHLLSGDRPEAVLDLGRTLELDSAEGSCTPTAKRERIAALQAGGAVVAFVGDGVNDAPALAQADAGISLPGLDAIRAAASLNLLREGLHPLLAARRLALRTRKVIRQNLAWAFGYNLLLIPLAALGTLDRFGGPMLAGAAMGLSSLTVVLNAWRLRRV